MAKGSRMRGVTGQGEETEQGRREVEGANWGVGRTEGGGEGGNALWGSRCGVVIVVGVCGGWRCRADVGNHRRNGEA